MRKAIALVLAVVGLALLGVMFWQSAGSDGPPASPPERMDTPPPPDAVPSLPETGPAPEGVPVPGESPVGILVRVVSAVDGAPIEGAQVEIESRDDVWVAGHTDAAGEYRIAKLPEGDVYVRARARGFARSSTRKPEPEVLIALERGLEIAGIVTEAENGRPLVGADVILTVGGSVGNRSSMSDEPLLGRTTTDAGGRFGFDVVPAAEIVTVTARLRGFETASHAVELAVGARAPREVALELAAAGTVTGTVLDPDGTPVPFATVYAIPADGGDMLLEEPDLVVTGDGRTWRSIRARSGEDGRYELSGLTIGGSYVLRAEAEGFAHSLDIPDVLPTAERRELAHDLRLRRNGGAVLNLRGPDGAPVTKALATLWGMGWPQRYEPDESGAVRIDDLPPGAHSVRLEAEGLLQQELEFEVEGGKTTELVVSFEAGVAISGVVVDDLGRPVPGAKVEARRPFHRKYRDLPSSSAKAVADEGGRFRIEGLRPGPHAVQANVDGLDNYWNGPFEAPSESNTVEILRYGKATAKLVLPAGSPEPEWITVVSSSRQRNEAVWGRIGRGWSQSSVPWSGGDYKNDFVRSGDVEMLLRVEGYGPVRRTFRLAPGEAIDLGEIRLGPGFAISGRVVDPGGQPVSGAYVAVRQGVTDFDPVATAADGAFRIEALGEGGTEITVEAEGFLTETTTTDSRAGAAPLTIRLSRGGLLEGELVDAAGKPAVARLIVVFAADDEEVEWLETDHRGRFSARLPAGTYRLEISRDGEQQGTAEVGIEEGARTPVRVELSER